MKVTATRCASLPNCCEISIPAMDEWALYHFEGEDGPCIIDRSYPQTLAVYCELARFFGGKVVFQDVDGKVRRYAKPKYMGRKSDRNFHLRNVAMMNLKAPAPEYIATFEKHAAYK